MSQLIRHIAGIPTATEQRCVRCCKVIRMAPGPRPEWPGSEPFYGVLDDLAPVDCTPVDLCAIDDVDRLVRLMGAAQ